MNHQPLSASFVLGWASLNSAELSRSGRAVISIQLAWLTGPAGQEVLCTGVWVKSSLLQPSLPAASQPQQPTRFWEVTGGQHGGSGKGLLSPGPQQGIRAVGAASERKTSLLTEGLAQGHSQDSTWPGTGPPPARIALRKRRGAPGRGQELPAPAWARRHTGRNVPSSAGPPSACRLPHPGIAECNPRAGWGVLTAGAASSPTTTSLHFAFVHKRISRKPRCMRANLEVSMDPATQGTNHPRPEAVAHYAQADRMPRCSLQ